MAIGHRSLQTNFCFSFFILPFLAPSVPPFVILCLSLLIHLGRCFTAMSLRITLLYCSLKFLPWQHKFSENFEAVAALILLTLIGSATLSSGWHIQWSMLWPLISSCMWQPPKIPPSSILALICGYWDSGAILADRKLEAGCNFLSCSVGPSMKARHKRLFLEPLSNRTAGIWEWGTIQLSSSGILAWGDGHYCTMGPHWAENWEPLPSPPCCPQPLCSCWRARNRKPSSTRTCITSLGLLPGVFPCSVAVSHFLRDTMGQTTANQKKGLVMVGERHLSDPPTPTRALTFTLWSDTSRGEDKFPPVVVISGSNWLQGEQPIHHIAKHHSEIQCPALEQVKMSSYLCAMHDILLLGAFLAVQKPIWGSKCLCARLSSREVVLSSPLAVLFPLFSQGSPVRDPFSHAEKNLMSLCEQIKESVQMGHFWRI